MNEHNSQGLSSENRKEHNKQGGFLAVLHQLEEQFYGPDSPLDAKGKIMLYIRHRALRDWTDKKRIPKHEILEATGLKTATLKVALRNLEKEKHILVTRVLIGKVWSDNIYQLHPERYGTDYIYRPEKPTFKLIHGSKGHKSNVNLGENTTLGEGSNTVLGVGENTTLGGISKLPIIKGNSLSKNPLKEPIKKTLSENQEKSENGELLSVEDLERERETAERIKQAIRQNLKPLPKDIPNTPEWREAQLKAAYSR